jgi:hypothetical protein
LDYIQKLRDVEYGNDVRHLLELYNKFFQEGLTIINRIKDKLEIPDEQPKVVRSKVYSKKEQEEKFKFFGCPLKVIMSRESETNKGN